MSAIYVDIGRIVLTNFDLASERAERIKGLVELKLQRMLEREGLAEGLENSEISNLSVPMIHPAELQSDAQLADTLAQRVTHALRGSG